MLTSFFFFFENRTLEILGEIGTKGIASFPLYFMQTATKKLSLISNKCLNNFFVKIIMKNNVMIKMVLCVIHSK